MKSLFQSIRAGDITRPAVESALAKSKADRTLLTRGFLAKQIGHDLYSKKLAELSFSVEMLQCVLDKWDDFRLPLKTGGNSNV